MVAQKEEIANEQENRGEDLRSLLTSLRPFFSLIPKAKTAKFVRGIIDSVAKIPGASDLQISLCKERVQWTRDEKRTFLRQRVEARLAALLMETKEYSEALTFLSGLVIDVRRLDDKLLLVGIDLLESKLHFSLRNLPKAKAALTAARAAAPSIFWLIHISSSISPSVPLPISSSHSEPVETKIGQNAGIGKIENTSFGSSSAAVGNAGNGIFGLSSLATSANSQSQTQGFVFGTISGSTIGTLAPSATGGFATSTQSHFNSESVCGIWFICTIPVVWVDWKFIAPSSITLEQKHKATY